MRPEHFDAHLGLGTDLARVQQAELAVDHLGRANQLRPRDPRPYRRLASVLSTLARYEEAIAALRVGLERLPDQTTIADRLAWALAQPLTQSSTLEQLKREAFEAVMRKARGVDAQEDFAEALPEGSWVTDRS